MTCDIVIIRLIVMSQDFNNRFINMPCGAAGLQSKIFALKNLKKCATRNATEYTFPVHCDL